MYSAMNKLHSEDEYFYAQDRELICARRHEENCSAQLIHLERAVMFSSSRRLLCKQRAGE
jgi:hypothetical protein